MECIETKSSQHEKNKNNEIFDANINYRQLKTVKTTGLICSIHRWKECQNQKQKYWFQREPPENSKQMEYNTRTVWN